MEIKEYLWELSPDKVGIALGLSVQTMEEMRSSLSPLDGIINAWLQTKTLTWKDLAVVLGHPKYYAKREYSSTKAKIAAKIARDKQVSG